MKTSVVHASYISIAHAFLAAVAIATAATASANEGVANDEPDEESDSAPFTVVVEHGSGWRCGAALVTLRTALTSAKCARGGGESGEMWARAPAPHATPGVSRVLRVAMAAGADLDVDSPWSSRAASRDVALLELSSALGGARPILLASSRADCDPKGAEAACYLVRALGSKSTGTLLRIVELSLRPTSVCWPPANSASSALGERALCLDGPDLCQSDEGAGVVCGGKLCGVLSGSRLLEGGCGAPHAAASVPRWRRFMHCAHTRGACGRDGECAQLCTERVLVEESVASPPTPPTPLATASPRVAMYPNVELEPPKRTTIMEVSVSVSVSAPSLALSASSSMPPPPTRSPSALFAAHAPTQEGASTARHKFEFEPNRADFTAGEYGDNGADYAAADDALPAASTAAPSPPPSAPPTAPSPLSPVTRRSAVQARVSPAKPLNSAPPQLFTSLLCLCTFSFVI